MLESLTYNIYYQYITIVNSEFFKVNKALTQVTQIVSYVSTHGVKMYPRFIATLSKLIHGFLLNLSPPFFSFYANIVLVWILMWLFVIINSYWVGLVSFNPQGRLKIWSQRWKVKWAKICQSLVITMVIRQSSLGLSVKQISLLLKLFVCSPQLFFLFFRAF